MIITPLSPSISTLEAVDKAFNQIQDTNETEKSDEGNPTFLDAMASLWTNAADAQAQKTEDMVNLMLGDTDNLEQVQINITKAELATQLLVTVKNSAVDAYNEIMRMSI